MKYRRGRRRRLTLLFRSPTAVLVLVLAAACGPGAAPTTLLPGVDPAVVGVVRVS